MSAEVQGYCPSCGSSSLFLGAGGYVTCSWSDCAEPDAATGMLSVRRRAAAEPESEFPDAGGAHAAQKPAGNSPQRATLPDTRYSNETTAAGIVSAEDRAAKRGRDEALAVVVKALRAVSDEWEGAENIQPQDEAAVRVAWQLSDDISDAIQHEAGGDGHE